MEKVAIAIAPVSGASTRVYPHDVARDVLRCVDFGASIVHLHVRDLTGNLTKDVTQFERTIHEIRHKSDLIIQASTGGVSAMSIEDRCAPLYCTGVEMASLNVGSVNLGDAVYSNPRKDVEYCSREIVSLDITPEFEIFEIGMINNVLLLGETIPFKTPLLFNFVLGYPGSVPATVESMIALRQLIPKGALWAVTHFDRRDFSLLGAAVGLGAKVVRLGFEYSNFLDANTTAESNAALVEKLARLIRSMDRKVATPDETRKMLKISPQS